MHVHQQTHEECDADTDFARLVNAPENHNQRNKIGHAYPLPPRQQIQQKSGHQAKCDKD